MLLLTNISSCLTSLLSAHLLAAGAEANLRAPPIDPGPLVSKFWSVPGVSHPAVHPEAVALQSRLPFFDRALTGKLGKWTASEVDALKQGVKAAAVQLLYEQDLQVGLGQVRTK